MSSRSTNSRPPQPEQDGRYADAGAQGMLGGRYRLDERLAGGGMGDVWAATDQVLGRPVAVKILRRELADDPTFRERFRAEARHAAGLSHAGIAAVYDYDDGTAQMQASPFLVLELVPGEPLSTLISRAGRLPPDVTMDIIGQAALALQVAHDGGVIHRDIKPGNLLVTPDGTVKITDFGISRATNSVPLTMTGAIMGTAYYLSPEQASGGTLSPASDIYSLGIVAYECLTGRRPFDGDTPVTVALAQVREEAPALPTTVPPAVRSLVMRMLAKEPSARPATAGEVGREALALRAAGGSAGGSADSTATQTLATIAAGATATSALGGLRGASGGPGADTDPGFVLPPAEAQRRWWHYLVPVAALLLALALAALLLGDVGSGPEAGSPTPSPTPSTSRPADATVDIVASSYIGRPVEEVRAELAALGMLVDLDYAEATGPPGTVASVSPDGAVSRGALITVTVIRATMAPADDDDRERGDRGKGKGKKKKDDEKDDD